MLTNRAKRQITLLALFKKQLRSELAAIAQFKCLRKFDLSISTLRLGAAIARRLSALTTAFNMAIGRRLPAIAEEIGAAGSVN